MTGRAVFEFVHPEDGASTLEALEHARSEALPAFENRYRTKDGAFRTIAWVASPEDPLIYAYGRDVTEERRREAELELAQEALRHSQKMEAIGQLKGGVAHDFNNLLTPIVGSLDLLQRRGVGGEREQRLIGGAIQSADRAKTLVQRLLAFARRQPLQAVSVDVAKLVTGMGDLVASTTGPQIKVVVDAPTDLPPATADANQLEMALLNLSVNARDAMPDGGTLRIFASAKSIRPGHRSKLSTGHYIRLSVADTGSGMDEATVARAVEPFFSTKGIGKGTGLGLSMVHGLASQLGGGLTIQSRPGLGTNVELWLPRSRLVPEISEAAPAACPAWTAPNWRAKSSLRDRACGYFSFRDTPKRRASCRGSPGSPSRFARTNLRQAWLSCRDLLDFLADEHCARTPDAAIMTAGKSVVSVSRRTRTATFRDQLDIHSPQTLAFRDVCLEHDVVGEAERQIALLQ